MVRVFLSYPSEVTPLGEKLSTRLTAAGFTVFFAPRDLQAAEAFDSVLARRVESADLFVFVITRGSITRGRYTLTELALAERYLGAKISKRLLPLMLEDGIAEQELPASLSPVHVLRPQGDPVAETVIALESLARSIRRRRHVQRTAALAVLLGIKSGAGYWTYLHLQPPGVMYEGPETLLAPAMEDAALSSTPAQLQRLALPNSFVGKRLMLLAFSSFEGTERDGDFWCVVTSCSLPEFAPGLRDHANESPSENYSHVHSGTKSLNFAPSLIPISSPNNTLSATRHKKVFDVAGAERVWLFFWRWSDSNPRPKAIHNCDSSRDIHYRLDRGSWQHLTSLCGAYPGEDLASGSFPNALNVLFNSAKTFELGLAFRVQNIEEPLQSRSFVIDDFILAAELPNKWMRAP